MFLQSVKFTDRLLSASDEVELATRIEAGVYAAHLLEQGQPDRPAMALRAIRDRGVNAWLTLWTCNLRLVMKLALESARRHHLPAEDLFQEGCLGLANAMIRWDHRRGLRFTSLAHDLVRWAIAACAASRAGAIDGPAHRQRIRRELRVAQERHGELDRQIRSRLGITAEAAALAEVRILPLEQAPLDAMHSSDDLSTVECHGTDFLNLLDPVSARILRLRYGLGGAEHTVEEVAKRIDAAPSTVRRLENRALARAKTLLSQEQCVMPETLPTLVA